MISPDSTILEFGSGEGSIKLSEIYNLYSIEHDPEWVGRAPKANYIHAPIVEIDPIPPFNHVKWYDRDAILVGLPEKIDLIIVDGPTGSIGRSGLLSILDHLPNDVIWIIDDTMRTEDSEVSRHISYILKLHETRLWNFSLLTRKPIACAILRAIKKVSDRVRDEEEDDYLDLFFTQCATSEG